MRRGRGRARHREGDGVRVKSSQGEVLSVEYDEGKRGGGRLRDIVTGGYGTGGGSATSWKVVTKAKYSLSLDTFLQ